MYLHKYYSFSLPFQGNVLLNQKDYFQMSGHPSRHIQNPHSPPILSYYIMSFGLLH